MSVGHAHAVSSFNSLVQTLGEVAAEEATLWNALKFVLMLWPLWGTWTDEVASRRCMSVGTLHTGIHELSTVGY